MSVQRYCLEGNEHECGMDPHDNGDWCRAEDVAALEAENAALKDEVDRYRLALESLTPGGSEYVRDPERCVYAVRDARSRLHNGLVKTWRELRASKAEVARLREAIEAEPEFPGEMPEDIWQAMRRDKSTATEALRQAVRLTKAGILERAALEGTSNEG